MDGETASSSKFNRLKRRFGLMSDDMTIHVDKLGFNGLRRETKAMEPLIWFVEVDCLITQARFRIRKKDAIYSDECLEIGASPLVDETEARLEFNRKCWHDPTECLFGSTGRRSCTNAFNLAFMSVLIWKCRGATKDTFSSRFCQLIAEFNPDFVLLLETHASLGVQNSNFHTLGFNATQASEPGGFAGGVWLLWKFPQVNLQQVAVTSQVVHVIVHKHRHDEWLMSSIHGNPTCSIMWKNLSDITSSYAVPWIADGEWDDCLSKQELTSARRHAEWRGMERLGLGMTTASPRYLWREKNPEASFAHFPEGLKCLCPIDIRAKGKFVVSADGADMGPLGPIGYACLVRDDAGNWVGAYTGFIGESTPLMAKLMGILLGLRTISEKGYKHCMLVSDCESALQIIKEGKELKDTDVEKVVKECRHRITKDNTTLKHIFREANRCAEDLARHSLTTIIGDQRLGVIGRLGEAPNVWMDSPPKALCPLLSNDIKGVCYESL